MDATNDTVKYAMCALFSLPSCPIHRIERKVKSIKGMNMVTSAARQSMKFTDVSSLPIFGVFISGFVCGRLRVIQKIWGEAGSQRSCWLG